jgi:adenosylcobyric acid synthase
VIPYLSDLSLEEEDGVALEHLKVQNSDRSVSDKIKVGVIYLPHISNFTDFDPLKKEPDVELFYIRKNNQVAHADVVILPGSKNTIEDLLYIRKLGIDQEICQFHRRGGQIVGICGGVQMLGRTIRDPHGIECDHQEVQGIGLLAVETILEKKKVTAQVEAQLTHAWKALDGWGRGGNGPPDIKGYEIHMGRTRRFGNTRPAFTIFKRNSHQVYQEDGAISPDGRVWGTYLHGLFENDSFRRWCLDRVRVKKERPGATTIRSTVHYDQEREQAFNRLAQIIRKHLDLKRIYGLLRH